MLPMMSAIAVVSPNWLDGSDLVDVAGAAGRA